MKYSTLILSSLTYMILLGCTVSQRITVSLENHSQHTITIKATAAGFTRNIRLAPGEKFNGWLPRVMVKSIEIDLTDQ